MKLSVVQNYYWHDILVEISEKLKIDGFKSDVILVRGLTSERFNHFDQKVWYPQSVDDRFNHFDQKVWYPQSVDILVLYIKSNFLRLHCGTIILQIKSKLKFWCNISINLSNCKNWFCSRKKTLKKHWCGTRKILSWVKFFQKCWNFSSILSIQISDRILKKTVWLVSETQMRNE